MIVVSTFNSGEGILFQEFFLDQFSGLKSNFLIGGKSFFTYKLHQILKSVFFLQDRFELRLESVEVRIDSFVEIWLKQFLVSWIRDIPINGGEMFLLG